jgi:hypothetical protein
MFPKKNWLEQNLATIGLWMTVGGTVSLVAGMIGEAHYYAAIYGAEGSSASPSKWVQAFWRILLDLCIPLIYNGVVLYLIGRVIGSWKVAIIGFEHSERDNLRVKGPDANHTVWIGRRYDSSFDADAAFLSLQRRFSKRGE